MKERPEGSDMNALQFLAGALMVVTAFGWVGWGWVGAFLLVDASVDYAIRFWHHRAAFSSLQKDRERGD